jgi:hypothetical protein
MCAAGTDISDFATERQASGRPFQRKATVDGMWSGRLIVGSLLQDHPGARRTRFRSCLRIRYGRHWMRITRRPLRRWRTVDATLRGEERQGPRNSRAPRPAADDRRLYRSGRPGLQQAPRDAPLFRAAIGRTGKIAATAFHGNDIWSHDEAPPRRRWAACAPHFASQ